MNQKGFTLVELLAVIVILAIIALIAIPLIGNVIEKAKIGALESSVNGLVESANMYYANNTIKGETVTETIFDFEDGEQVSDKKLEYKGKVYNGKLILHANGEVAVCIDDEAHYAYKNKDTDEIVSGVGTCLYDGTTGDFSSNNSVADLSGKIVTATTVTESGDNILINIPTTGYYDETSQISIATSELDSIVNGIDISDKFTINVGTKAFLTAYKSGKYIDFTVRLTGVTIPANTNSKVITMSDYPTENITVVTALNNSSTSYVPAVVSGDGIYLATQTSNAIVTISGRYRIA